MSDIVQVLRDYLAENPDVKEAFEVAVRMALRMNVPQLAQLGITDLNTYLDFYTTFLNWVPVETFDGKNIYYHLIIFHFILDLSPLRNLQTATLPASKSPYTWLSSWIIQFSKDIGKNMDKPESLTEESLQTFYDSPIYRMGDYLVPEAGWKTFNEFFAREINPALRPIDVPNDDTVIVHPADSTFYGGWDIESDGVVYLKYIPWHIEQLLEDSSDYKSEFGGGTFTHSLLGPNDYHRQHAPVSGTVLEARVIPGLCYVEVGATSDENGDLSLTTRRPTRSNRGLEGIGDSGSGSAALAENNVYAPNSPGYQFLQTRALILINNPTIGLVAVLPIGMAQISSVILSVSKGDTITKGQEISYFQFGGSDCVMVFQKKAHVKFTASLKQHYNFGVQIAKAFPGAGTSLSLEKA